MNSKELWNKVQNSLGDEFFRIVASEHLERVQNPKYPLKDQVHYCPSTEIAKLYKKLEDLDDLLLKQCEAYTEKQKEFDKRLDLAYERNVYLAAVMEKFDKYYKMSREKRNQLKQREAKEKGQISVKTHEVNRLKKELYKLEDLKIELERRINKVTVCKGYLHQVRHERGGEKFKTNEELIDRFSVLSNIRKSQYGNIISNMEDARKGREKLFKVTQKKQNEILASHLYIDELKVYSTPLEQSNLRLDDILEFANINTRKKLLSESQTQSAIQNLYILLCNQMNQPISLKKDDFTNQLRFIEKYMTEISKLNTNVRNALYSPSRGVNAEQSYQHIQSSEKQSPKGILSKKSKTPGNKNKKEVKIVASK